MEGKKRYFLTVEWCNIGRRGIFSSAEGNAFSKDTEHTYEEMWDILDCFFMILSPKSLPFDEQELKEYSKWYPLAEFSNQYGIALKSELEK